MNAIGPREGSASPEASRNWPRVAAFALAGAAVVACYVNSLGVPFLLDDAATIAENPSIKELGRIGAVLNPPTSSFSAGRPLLNLSFALNHAAGGLRVIGYHWTNLAIHLANAFLLWLVAARLLARARRDGRPRARTEWAAALVALLWAGHPLQTVCVTYISQRAESLMAFCYLLTIYCAIRVMENARALGWQVAAAVACLAGVLVKEVMVTAPVVCLLVDVWFFAGSWREAWQRRKRLHLSLVLSWAVLAWLMVETSLFGRIAGARPVGGSLAYGLTQLRAVGEYAQLALWPHPLIFDRGAAAAALAPFPVWRGLAFLAVAGGLTLWAVRRAPRLGFLGIAFFLLLAPTTSVVPIWGQPVAENRMYLPLACLAAGLVLAVSRAGGRWGMGALAAGAVAGGVLTVRRNGDFASGERIWADTVAKAPGNPRARGALGACLIEIPGRRTEAIAHLEAARRMDPRDSETHYQLGLAYSGIGDSEAHYRECLRLNPAHVMAHARLGALQAQLGRTPEAAEHLERAVRLRPDRLDFRVALGGLLAAIPGRSADAIAELEAAVREAPGHAEARMNLGNAYRAAPGGLPRAIAAYEAAVRLDPRLVGAWYNLGGALMQSGGRDAEARVCYENVLRLAPDFRAAAERLEQLRARGAGGDRR